MPWFWTQPETRQRVRAVTGHNIVQYPIRTTPNPEFRKLNIPSSSVLLPFNIPSLRTYCVSVLAWNSFLVIFQLLEPTSQLHKGIHCRRKSCSESSIPNTITSLRPSAIRIMVQPHQFPVPIPTVAISRSPRCPISPFVVQSHQFPVPIPTVPMSHQFPVRSPRPISPNSSPNHQFPRSPSPIVAVPLVPTVPSSRHFSPYCPYCPINPPRSPSSKSHQIQL